MRLADVTSIKFFASLCSEEPECVKDYGPHSRNEVRLLQDRTSSHRRESGSPGGKVRRCWSRHSSSPEEAIMPGSAWGYWTRQMTWQNTYIFIRNTYWCQVFDCIRWPCCGRRCRNNMIPQGPSWCRHPKVIGLMRNLVAFAYKFRSFCSMVGGLFPMLFRFCCRSRSRHGR